MSTTDMTLEDQNTLLAQLESSSSAAAAAASPPPDPAHPRCAAGNRCQLPNLPVPLLKHLCTGCRLPMHGTCGLIAPPGNDDNKRVCPTCYAAPVRAPADNMRESPPPQSPAAGSAGAAARHVDFVAAPTTIYPAAGYHELSVAGQLAHEAGDFIPIPELAAGVRPPTKVGFSFLAEGEFGRGLYRRTTAPVEATAAGAARGAGPASCPGFGATL